MVDVVVPTRNNLSELKRCLRSVERQSVATTCIHVCVDGSTDETLDFLAQARLDIQMLVHQHSGGEHRGRSATRNLALNHFGSEHVLFLDSDMVLGPDAIAAHLASIEPGRVSVGSIRYLNRDRDLWAGYLSRRGRNRYADGAYLPFTQFTTANALVAAEDVRALNGFDERFTGYGGEDVEFAYRLERLGRSFINTTAAIAETTESKGWLQAIDQFQGYGATNLRLMMDLHPDMTPTFELRRLTSRRLVDRAFVWALNPIVGALVRGLIRVGPRPLQFRLLNYEVIRAIFRGYLAGTSP